MCLCKRNRRRDRQTQEVCGALIWERPRTGMGEEGERFKEVPTVRVLQVHGESHERECLLKFCVLLASP